ncbi:MAG: flagellar basal body P-ring protein FlgI [Phycisphaerales bacterium]
MVTVGRRNHSGSLFAPLAVAATTILGGLLACSNEKEPPPAITTREVAPPNLPQFLRGTVRYEAELQGFGPSIVTGYGIVVGLDGTGSADTPMQVRALMEREASRMLEQTQVTDAQNFSVSRLLDSNDTAVVFVEALVPPGAPEGTEFDLLIEALPGTSTTSLEGGRLWTTRLMQGLVVPGAPERQSIALGRGELFLNPFADPERSGGGTTVNRRRARVLGGGVMTRSMPLVLMLRSPSFARSRAIVYAINGRFPQEAGQDDITARAIQGSADERISITVPPSWRGRTDEFVETLMATPIRQGATEQRAYQLSRWIKENPLDAQAVSWCWVALGKLATPVIQELYEYPEAIVRLAALKAGAKLEDPLVIDPLSEIALDPQSEVRTPALDLLGEMPGAARVGVTLRQLLDDESRNIRVAAFEGLRRQNDPIVRRLTLGPQAPFELYAVPSKHPMVYATQQGRPRIVVFGDGISIERPVVVDTWSSRFIMVGDDESGPVRLRYQNPRTGEVATYERPADLVDFIRFLGDDGLGYGSDGGLDMSYSDTIRALYAMEQSGAITAPLVPEEDNIRRELNAARQREAPVTRPETAGAETVDPTIPAEGVTTPTFPDARPATSESATNGPPPARPESGG